jgi:hypothetical protein
MNWEEMKTLTTLIGEGMKTLMGEKLKQQAK